LTRPILYDATHLIHRYAYDAPSGIDRVDLAYGRHFGLKQGKIAAGLHYGHAKPQVLEPSRVGDAVRNLEDRWRETIRLEDDQSFSLIKQWLHGKSINKPLNSASPVASLQKKFKIGVLPFLRYAKWRSASSQPLSIPEGAIYLNIAQHAMEHAEFFTWLNTRPDIRRVFFLHDLLPLDYPEFWWSKHEALFERRIRVMIDHASALMTSSKAVRERAMIEMARRGKPDIPIFALPLPSPIETLDNPPPVGELSDYPYFLMIGTIEARKNHGLILNIWRQLAASGGVVPKLIVLGKRGWENEQAVGLLERCHSIEPFVLEVSGLSNAGLRQLIVNANALLMPSFAEGYGLPLIEALSLGTPAIASDIPVFRETTQGKAIFLNPLDGPGWQTAILDLAKADSPLAQTARAAAKAYVPQTTSNYFAAIEDFLASL
jgi:glycosyltransferase involved in cell wall biosynthesis